MSVSVTTDISVPLVQAIEDAVLLGNIKELDGVLDLIDEEGSVPDKLRYGLEALMYFRLYYGKSGELVPSSMEQKQQAARMELSWGRELIEMIGHYPDLTELKMA